MQIRFVTQRGCGRIAAHLLGIFIILAIAFPVTITANAAPPASSAVQRSGTNILVTTTDDTLDPGDSLCSLREAIIAANTNTSSGDTPGECPAGTDDRKDIITLAAGATYALTIAGGPEFAARTGDLDIWDNTAETDLIIGVQDHGAATIDASSLGDRIFDIFSAATVNMTGLTLTGGNAVPEAVGEDVGGGGVQIVEGFLTMASSVVTGNSATFGGGIANWDGTVKLSDTIVSDNIGPGAGGGILNSGTLKIENSLISGNAADNGGGGGIWSDDVLYIASTEVSGNRASGGAGLYSQDVTARARISDNTMFRGNTASNMGSGISNDGDLSMNGGEVSGNSADWSAGGIFNRYLATMTLDGVKVADNAANNDGGGGFYNEGTLSLTGATVSGNHANGDGGGILNNGTLTVDSSNLFGNSGQGGGALANLPDAVATVRNGTQVHDNSAGSGGGLFNYARLTVNDSKVADNKAEYGGGLSNWGGELTLSASTVSGNSASASSGGIHNQGGGTVSIEGASVITGNTAVWDGGGINNWDGRVTVRDSTVSNNSVPQSGGGINNLSTGTLVLQAATLSGNTASGNEYSTGGGLANWGGQVAFTASTVSGNSASWAGAITTSGGTLTLDATVVTGNTSSNDAGGIHISNGSEVMVQNGSEISDNHAAYGGGIANWGSTLTIDASTVSGNSAEQSGGGVLNKDGGTTTIQNGSLISGNSATYEGGLSNWDSSDLKVDASTISYNTASWNGGGIGNLGTLTVTGSAFFGNTATRNGDALRSSTGVPDATVVTGSCFVGNGDIAVYNTFTAVQNATQNWWGDASGPSGDGPGSGDSVGDSIDFSDWLTEAPPICGTP